MPGARKKSRKAPLIGIDCSSDRNERSLNPVSRFLNQLPLAYSRSVERVGGVPLMLPLVEKRATIERMLQEIDGLLLSGGNDVDPSYYGQEPHPKLGQQDVDKDRFERILVPLALERKNLPILGLCRGIQSLNVFAGGTLLQDVYAQGGKQVLKHRQATDRSTPSHTLILEPGTRLHKIFGKRRIRSNSYHHQVVDQVAPGFMVSARSTDGLIEGIELPGERFVVGFQPHPEVMTEDYPEFRKLFRALVEAARNASS